ncbi:MAG TPA: metallophosphoesterase, partial [Gemmataceae bacterium]|nr:metallophosphoesterase [Gemmataceae bacterium]
MSTVNGSVRVAAVADIHCTRTSQGTLQQLLAAISANADVCLLCGDLTDYGLPEEAQTLTKELKATMKIPVLAVLGNHDYESGKQVDLQHILSDAGVHVLDGDACEVRGVGFAGVKGFAGGFGRGTLEPWGEPTIKHFVHEAVDEALKLEGALARLHTSQRVALLHYAPIADTVAGEPLEIFPFLGSGRLEEPVNRYAVNVVFHGHAHHGSPEGRTRTGVPVYNVAVPVLR